MKAHVNDACIGCGLCASICPEVFQMNDEGLAEAAPGAVPEELEAPVIEARDSCPVSAIETEEA